jgi:hypothetical protein
VWNQVCLLLFVGPWIIFGMYLAQLILLISCMFDILEIIIDMLSAIMTTFHVLLFYFNLNI